MATKPNPIFTHHELVVGSKAYPAGDKIPVKLILASGVHIKSYTVKSNGLELTNSLDKNSDAVEIILALKGTKGDITINMTFSDGEKYTANLYAIKTEKGVYLSPKSYEGADRVRMHNELTEEEFYEKTFERQGVKLSLKKKPIAVSTRTRSLRDTIRFHLTWNDYLGKSHPLIDCKCEIYADIRISGYSDANGVFTASIPKDSTIYTVIVYTETTHVNVSEVLNGRPYAFGWGVNRNPDQYININGGIQNEELDTIRHAYEITQALYFGYKYVQEMSGNTFSQKTIQVVYPNGSSEKDQTSYYSSGNNSLYIYKTAYLSWDIVLHEFGHLLQWHYGITANPGGSHTMDNDQISDYKDKSIGIRLAWGEAWPTVFAIMATQYYNLSDYPLVNDAKYDANNGSKTPTNFWDKSLEASRDKEMGEGCEMTIIRVLYDMFDAASETGKDYMTMTHQNFWKLITESKATTMYEFAKKVYSDSNFYGNFGIIMSANNIAGKIFGIKGKQIEFKVGGNPKCDLSYQNKAQVDFCSGHFGTFLTSFEPKITKPDSKTDRIVSDITVLDKIFDDPGSNISCRLQTWQTDSPATGPYYTQWLTLSKPLHVNNVYVLPSDKLANSSTASIAIDGKTFKVNSSNTKYSAPYTVMNLKTQTIGVMTIESPLPVYGIKFKVDVQSVTMLGTCGRVVISEIDDKGKVIKMSTKNLGNPFFGTTKKKSFTCKFSLDEKKRFSIAVQNVTKKEIQFQIGNILVNTGKTSESFF